MTSAILSFLVAFAPVWAGDTVVISATAFPEVVSIRIADNRPDSIVYGALPYGAVNQDPKDNPTLGVENNGSVAENFHIRGADATTSGGTWTLSNTPGVDQYVHKFKTIEGATFTPLTEIAGNNELVNNIALGGTQDFKLRIDMPTPGTGGPYKEYSTTVTVVANAH